MKEFPTDFWGKLATTDSRLEWHPLIDHCADVAATCEALLTRTLIRRRLAILGERDDLTDFHIQRLSALAAFHDIGKFNLGFQNKADPGRQPKAGHVVEIWRVLSASDSREFRRLAETIPLAAIETWAEESSGGELLIAAIAHHGRPFEAGAGSGPTVEIWRAERNGRDPFEGISRLSARIRQWFPAAFDCNTTALPSKPAFVHAFCGLVTLA